MNAKPLYTTAIAALMLASCSGSRTVQTAVAHSVATDTLAAIHTHAVRTIATTLRIPASAVHVGEQSLPVELASGATAEMVVTTSEVIMSDTLRAGRHTEAQSSARHESVEATTAPSPGRAFMLLIFLLIIIISLRLLR